MQGLIHFFHDLAKSGNHIIHAPIVSGGTPVSRPVKDAAYPATDSIGVDGWPVGRLFRRTGQVLSNELDPVCQVRLPLGQLDDKSLQLVTVQPVYYIFNGRMLLDAVLMMDTFKESSHDMLANATPIVRTTAISIMEGPGMLGDMHPVGTMFTSLDLCKEVIAPPRHRQDRAILVIFSAPVK
jgi:hypothetical protein